MTVLFQALGVNKWLAYMILGMTLLSGVSILFLKIRGSGRDAEKLKQAESGLERMRTNAEISVRVQRASTDSARERLRSKYGLGRS